MTTNRSSLILPAGLLVLAGVYGWMTIPRWLNGGDRPTTSAGSEWDRLTAENYRRQEELPKKRDEVLAECRRLLPASPGTGGNIVRKGKVIIWDGHEVDVGLPDRLKGDFLDAEFTIVWIFSQERVQVKSYSERPGATAGTTGADRPSVLPGYRSNRTVAVFHWPDKRLVGWAEVIGEDPPASLEVFPGESEVVGETARPLRAWIEGLPSAGR